MKKPFNIIFTKYYLPFDKLKIFNKISYIVSHLIWSFIVAKKYFKINQKYANYNVFTRSNWILFFFAIKNVKVVFEVHKQSKTTRLIFFLLKNKKNVGFVFLNLPLLESFKLNNQQLSNSITLHNSFDEEDFKEVIFNPKPKTLVFMGRLTRYNQSRNINFLIDAFKKNELENYQLFIIGGPNKSYNHLKSEVTNQKIKNITVLNHMPQNELLSKISKIDIGILINSGFEENSRNFTSPLKYFEYLRTGLKVVAINFNAHKVLPYSDQIFYFQENNIDSFINSVENASRIDSPVYFDLEKYSYKNRALKVANLFARLEGFEPPTL
jgi:hypothetical protein